VDPPLATGKRLKAKYYFTANEPSLAVLQERSGVRAPCGGIDSYFAVRGSRDQALVVFPSREAGGRGDNRALLIRLLTGMPVYPTAFLDAEAVRDRERRLLGRGGFRDTGWVAAGLLLQPGRFHRASELMAILAGARACACE